MAIQKDRKDKLLELADTVIHGSKIFNNGKGINESYNGQIAAFSVTVALSGLTPAMALYMNSGEGSSGTDKKEIIRLLAKMYEEDKGEKLSEKESEKPEALYNKAIKAKDQDKTALQRAITQYAIALKLAVRTFKLIKS